MNRKIILSLLVLLGLSEFVKLIMNLPGDPSNPVSSDTEQPKTWRDLYEEFGTRLPLGAYKIFAHAVEAHLKENYEKAKEEYKKLTQLEQSNGTKIDLAQWSQVLKHNIQLLEKFLKNPFA